VSSPWKKEKGEWEGVDWTTDEDYGVQSCYAFHVTRNLMVGRTQKYVNYPIIIKPVKLAEFLKVACFVVIICIIRP
jgi:hypothetical protein